MKEYYIYLTIVHHPTLGDLYYAGKKKSKGPEKDKKYHGSCNYRYWKKWLREHEEWFETTILGWFDTEEEQSHAESLLIQDCLKEHGAFLYGTYTAKKKKYRSWLDQFGKGTCLNGHWCDLSHAREFVTREVQDRQIQTRRDNGSMQKFLDAGHKASLLAKSYLKAVEAARAPEVRQRLSETIRHLVENGQWSDASQMHTPEVQAKIKNSNKRVFIWLYNGSIVYIGRVISAVQAMKHCGQIWDQSEDAIPEELLTNKEWFESHRTWYHPSKKTLMTNGTEVITANAVCQRVIKGNTTWEDWTLTEFTS